MRTRIAGLLSLPENKVRIQYWEGSGSFGNAPARHDGGQAAAVMSQLAGAPVRLQFMRWDEHGWDNYGPRDHGRHPRRRSTRAARSSRYEFTGFGMAAIGLDPTTQHVGTAGPRTGNRRARHGQLGDAVRHPAPPRDRQDRAADQQLLQDVDDAGAAGSADRLRLGAADRRARVRVEDGSVPVPAQEHLRRPTRTAGATCSWASGSSRTGSRRWPRRACRARTWSRGRGIALGSYAGSQAGVVADIEVNKKHRQDPGQARVRDPGAGLGVSLEGLESQMMGSMIMGDQPDPPRGRRVQHEARDRASTG